MPKPHRDLSRWGFVSSDRRRSEENSERERNHLRRVWIGEDVVETYLGECGEPAQREPRADADVDPNVIAGLRPRFVGFGVIPAGSADDVWRRRGTPWKRVDQVS